MLDIPVHSALFWVSMLTFLRLRKVCGCHLRRIPVSGKFGKLCNQTFESDYIIFPSLDDTVFAPKHFKYEEVDDLTGSANEIHLQYGIDISCSLIVANNSDISFRSHASFSEC